MNRRSPQITYGALALGATAAISILLYLWLGWNPYWLWLLVVNVVTFIYFRYDKRQAQHEGAMRVPEVVLLLLMLIGGFIGAGIGMYMRPRHKVRKPKFVVTLVLSAILQALVLWIIYLR